MRTKKVLSTSLKVERPLDWFKKEQHKGLAEGISYVKSTSFLVIASHTMSLMHGGKVIGLRSYEFPYVSVKLQA
jgi:hypothetical protein